MPTHENVQLINESRYNTAVLKISSNSIVKNICLYTKLLVGFSLVVSLLVSATVCLEPHETETTFSMSSTSLGSVFTPSECGIPSWPLSFHPQVYRSPHLIEAVECQPPADIQVTGRPAKLSTRVGESRVKRSPWPSWPRLKHVKKKNNLPKFNNIFVDMCEKQGFRYLICVGVGGFCQKHMGKDTFSKSLSIVNA